MRPNDIDRFFRLLAGKVSFPVTVVLTGGGAAILEGVSRATEDLDFQIVLRNTTEERRHNFQRAIEAVERECGIAAQYDSNIETWSSIVWPSPRPKSYPYKRWGSVEVRILDPLWWSIDKMARYLFYDVSDVITVFKTMKISANAAARAWGRALGRSPLSNAQPVFQRQVIEFFTQHGRKLWGKSFDLEQSKIHFLKTASETAKIKKL